MAGLARISSMHLTEVYLLKSVSKVGFFFFF